MEDARALLNSLMGGDRNTSGKVKKERTFTDDDICRTFLLGLCPNELFQNTKSDIGPCGKHHNENLKEMFEKDAKADMYRRKWRGPLIKQLKQLLDTVNRRIESNQLRVAQEKERGGPVQQEPEKITALKEEMSERLKQAEAVADAGRYDESKAIMKEVDVLKRRIEDLQAKRAMNSITKENVCEVCGLMVSAEESEDIKKYGRGWHTDGKQHIGFLVVREKMKELEAAHARDRKNGLRTPTPSPVKAPPKNDKRKRSRSLPARNRDANKRQPSRSPRRDKRADDRRRRPSRSRSHRRCASRSRSPWRKNDSRRHGSRSPRQRRERSQNNKNSKHTSPKRRSRSGERSAQRSSPSVSRRRQKTGESVREEASKAEEVSADAESGKSVKFVLGLGKIPVSAVGKPESAGGADEIQPTPALEEEAPEEPRRSRSRRRRRRREEAQEAAATSATQDAPQTEEPKVEEEPAKPEEEPAEDPEPPKPVRFVLGLGKLNVNALKKR